MINTVPDDRRAAGASKLRPVDPWAILLRRLVRETNFVPPAFPDHLPPGCPKATARDASQKVYRLVTEFDPDQGGRCAYMPNPRPLPLGPEYFISHTEAGFGNGNCDSAALSVHVTLEGARELTSLPRFKGALIAVAKLRPRHGKISPPSGGTHRNIWLTREALARVYVLFEAVQ